jgi:3-oxoacyl-[acyl-carrier-protein] synthase II
MTNQARLTPATPAQSPPRVVITGMGAITPLGLTVAELWQGLLAGRSGIGPITRFDPHDLRTTIAGEVRNFDPQNYMDRKEARRLDPCIQYALAASSEAVTDAKLDFRREDPYRVGVIVGSGIGGLQTTIASQITVMERGANRISPFAIPNILVDSPGGRIAIEYHAQGINHAVISACATGTGICGEGFEILRRGDADVLLVGGIEAGITPLAMGGFDVMGVLSQRNDDPSGASRPFDRERDGFVLSEGGAILVLETEEHALARGASIYAEVVGYGSSADAFHMAAPQPEAEGAIAAMRMALRKAAAYGVQPEAIDYINAHGTATRINDVSETYAIKQALGDHAYRVQISSTKSMLGHMMGAAGAVEAIICAKAIQDGAIPPTVNLHTPDLECDLDYTPLQTKHADVQVALSNSFGLGGHNACIILRRYVL